MVVVGGGYSWWWWWPVYMKTTLIQNNNNSDVEKLFYSKNKIEEKSKKNNNNIWLAWLWIDPIFFYILIHIDLLSNDQKKTEWKKIYLDDYDIFGCITRIFFIIMILIKMIIDNHLAMMMTMMNNITTLHATTPSLIVFLDKSCKIIKKNKEDAKWKVCSQQHNENGT